MGLPPQESFDSVVHPERSATESKGTSLRNHAESGFPHSLFLAEKAKKELKQLLQSLSQKKNSSHTDVLCRYAVLSLLQIKTKGL